MPRTSSVPRLSHQPERPVHVGDLDRAQGFSQRVPGLELFPGDNRMSALGPRNSVLLLFRKGGSLQPTPVEDGGGRVHLCRAIPRNEPDAWDAHLRELAVPVESRIGWRRGSTSLYLRDPDDSPARAGHAGPVAGLVGRGGWRQDRAPLGLAGGDGTGLRTVEHPPRYPDQRTLRWLDAYRANSAPIGRVRTTS